MSKKTVTEDATTFAVPFRSIFVPPKQLRGDLPEIPQLAERLKEEGLKYPVLVSKGGPKGYQYTLNEGYRRMESFAHNGWGNREILVSVQEKSDAFSRIVTNWTANMDREGINYIDQCECVATLLDGTYPVLEGETSEPVDVETVSKRLGISANQIGRMAKVWKYVDKDVLSLARKSQAPSYLMEKIATIKGEGDDETARDEDRATKQSAILAEWMDKRRALEEQGRKRAVRSDKGAKKNGKKKSQDEPVGVVNPEKKVTHAVYKTEKDRGYSVDDYVRVLVKKQEEIAKDRSPKPVRELTPKEQVIRLTGIIDGMRFMKGEITKLPDLTKADFDVLKPAAVTEAEAE